LRLLATRQTPSICCRARLLLCQWLIPLLLLLLLLLLARLH
jgi:hypothetical protein